MKKLSGSGTRRLFIAIKILPDEKLSWLISEFRSSLSKEKIKWSEPGNLHITLAFLGDTDVSVIPSLKEMLTVQCSGSGQFQLIIKGAGLFRNLRDPRVIWVGIDPAKELTDLFNSVKSGLISLGLTIEERSFSPHLTIGRIKSLTDTAKIASLINRFADSELQIQKVEKIILYESVLLPAGPVYKPLSEVWL